jgi:RHS repeat-associated protein
MLASSFLDPVLGIDVHFEMVPTPAPVPTPIPNPFIGIVFDPIGLAAGIALGAAIGAVMGAPFQGPVLYWTAFPATNTGTEAKAVPGHILIPPGVSWAPFPKTPKPVIHPGEVPKPGLPVKPEDDAVVVFGSKTVTVMGSNAVRLGDIALSCSEPLRLPSSVVLAVPKGAPILIGGPPSLDIMAAVLASLRTRFVSDSLHALVSRMKPSRFRNFLHRVVCFFTGHPVDVASGKVMTEFVDAALPGPLPLRIERIYSSAFASRSGPLGYGWSFSLNQAIWRERGKVVLLSEDGREIEFDTFDCSDHQIAPGQSVYNAVERLTLHCDPGENWRVIDHEGRTRSFAPVAGRREGRAMIQRLRSRCGHHEIAWSYDDAGRLAWVRDSGGRMIGVGHDARGRIHELYLPNPEADGFHLRRRYVYDDMGDLVEVVDAMGERWHFAYQTHLLTRETDRNGLSFHFAYDGLGEDAWCVRTWGDGGIHDHVLSYDKQKHITWVTDSLGFTTTYHMNLAGLVVKIVDPLGGTKVREYDPTTLQLVRTVDELGNEERRRHDERGNLVATVAADGGETTLTWSGLDKVGERDARGGEWRWQYGAGGLLLDAQSPAGRRVRRHWHAGLLVAFEHGPERRTTLHWDEHKQLRALGLANGVYERYEHDRLGRLVAIHHASGGVTRLTHDLEDRIVIALNATGDEQRLVYDPEGHVLEVRDGVREVKLAYTGFQRLALREEAGVQQRYEYDTEGRLMVVVNEAGERFSVVRDPAGRISKETGFDGRSWTFVRDAAGREVEVRAPSGRVRKHAWDAAGRALSTEHADGSFVRFAYDELGRLREARNEHACVAIERDGDGLVRKEQTEGGEVHSAYDEVGARVELSTSHGTRMLISRNALGEPQRLYLGRDADHRQLADVGLAHTPIGALRSLYFANGIEVAWQHDPAGRPTARTLSRHRNGEAEVRERQDYVWRGESQLRKVTTLGKATRRYDHDGRGQLIRERIDDAAIPRAIDAAGNVYRSETGDDRRYGPGGRIEQVAGHRVEHDEDGNQTLRVDARGEWRYRWNDHGLLSAIERPDGARVEFQYDAFARRIARRLHKPGGELERETKFVWDGHTVVNELDSVEGTTTWHWLPDTPTPILKEHAGRRWSIAGDHLGTPLQMHDESGAAAWSARLDVFGRIEVELGEARDCPWRWPGQYDDGFQDEYYNRCRYYSPTLGRFISQDPAGLHAGLNRYAYVGDPITWIDLLGLTGTYIFTFKSGEMYVGKGPHDRALASQKIRTAEVGSGATITQGAHMDFGDNKMGLMVEAELMKRNNFGTNSNMLNAINSPGKDLLANATPAEKALVKANADALEAAHNKSTGKIC